MTCPDCKTIYQVKHTCHYGLCIHCSHTFKSVKDHKCPILQLANISIEDVWNGIRHETVRCDGCDALYFSNRDERVLHTYKKVKLCSDCYSAAEIQQEKASVMQALTMLDVENSKVECAMCKKALIAPKTARELFEFRRVYTDYFCTDETIWSLVAKGSDWENIRAAVERCRNLCIRCHSFFGIAKRCIGIHRLKPLKNHISAKVLNMAETKVERLCEHMLFHQQEAE